ncbi:hypothetical protein [Methylorubrum podarium]|jgi:hypothetical protein|uniref:hypothetical protein n=1 Tax=Methylorubrum podarium TaxID=200476 RepID=UPI001EE347FE|nr:hypothetical protein [Methylorubrum podarium]GJE70169.1 hypothetical protein CHKEEEPN_1703 [Methylorubrum podarium]
MGVGGENKNKGQAEADDGLTQSERFIKAAQELGTDDDPERFAERVRKLAKAPAPQERPPKPEKP